VIPRSVRARTLSAALAVTLVALVVAGERAAVAQPGDGAPGSYIVVLRDGEDPAAFAQGRALRPVHTYSRVFRGFAAELTSAEVRRLRADPRVRGVAPNRTVRVMGVGAVIPGEAAALPTGVDRIDAEHAPVIEDAPVAVVDSGIDLGRPEFNIAGALSFVAAEPSPQDSYGHGTHVAGIAVANTMGSGFRGVAPRAPLWSLKAIDASGESDLATLIAPIDWLTANAPSLGIRVANMSLGFGGTDSGNCGVTGDTVVDPYHYAICQSVQAGIIYVVSAGNGSNSAGLLPAAYPEVVAVSNVWDNDGRGGALTPPSDDTFLAGSSFGSTIDVAAPGLILSTVPVGSCVLCSSTGYGKLTGTSMSAPHVAGALAQYVSRNPSVSTVGGPGVLAQAALDLIAAAKAQASPCGFTGDPDASPEPMVYVGVPDSACGALAMPDADGDGLPDGVETGVYSTNPADPDSDDDGCTDWQEVQGHESSGGRRDPNSTYDFTDVPAPAGPATGADGKLILAATAARNRAVSLADVSVVLAYVGRTSANPAYAQDNNTDGLADGAQLDRTPSADPSRPWRAAAPSGAISLQDVSVTLVQVGHNCVTT